MGVSPRRIECDACHADITDHAKILLADGRVICAVCTALTPEQKVAPQIGRAAIAQNYLYRKCRSNDGIWNEGSGLPSQQADRRISSRVGGVIESLGADGARLRGGGGAMRALTPTTTATTATTTTATTTTTPTTTPGGATRTRIVSAANGRSSPVACRSWSPK